MVLGLREILKVGLRGFDETRMFKGGSGAERDNRIRDCDAHVVGQIS